VTEVKDLEQWAALAGELQASGYTRFMWQFGTDRPEGLFGWFVSPGRPDIEIMTRDPAVEEAALKYKLQK
jgi:hypothetical protein